MSGKTITYRINGADNLSKYIGKLEIKLGEVIRELNTLKNFKLEICKVDNE